MLFSFHKFHISIFQNRQKNAIMNFRAIRKIISGNAFWPQNLKPTTIYEQKKASKLDLQNK